MILDLHIAKQYLKYRTRRISREIHSPFVFQLIENVFRDKRRYYSYDAIERRRNELLRDNRMVKVTELGAGSRVQGPAERRVSDIVKLTAKPVKYGQLLHRLAYYLDPKNILELGTSLGISTAYLASAHSKSQVITLEGWPEISEMAKDTFRKLRLDNVKLVTGNFDDTLAPVLQQLPVLDLGFIDGNHRKEPTLRYFSQCLTKINNESLLIFDDIHWARDMEEAWEEIKAHPAVTLSIDIFFMGMVFFKKEIKEKQHFVLKY
jgi:predicted O-methyltransferase YrrM